MTKLLCPHCGKQGISFLRKLFLGPAVSTKCKVCGNKVGVPYLAVLAIIPFLGSIVAAQFTETFMLKVVLWIAGFVVMSIIHMRWVHLKPR